VRCSPVFERSLVCVVWLNQSKGVVPAAG